MNTYITCHRYTWPKNISDHESTIVERFSNIQCSAFWPSVLCVITLKWFHKEANSCGKLILTNTGQWKRLDILHDKFSSYSLNGFREVPVTE